MYLGSVFKYGNDCSQDLWTRIGKATESNKIDGERISPTTQKTFTGNNIIQHSAIWVWNLDIQQKD